MYKITLDKEDFLRYQLFTASQSKRIKNKRIRTWILVTITFLFAGLIMRQNPDKFYSYYFIGFSIITLIFYPLYQRRHYKKHYEKHIDENYSNKIGVESEIGFENGFIVSVGDNQEGKIKLTEIQEINEISENLFIKIKTGESVIIPTQFTEYDNLKMELADLVEPLGVIWKNQQDWKWK
jgi:hypothetical protein